MGMLGKVIACKCRSGLALPIFVLSILFLLPGLTRAAVFFPESSELEKAKFQDGGAPLSDPQAMSDVLALAEPGTDYVQIDDMRFKINDLVQYDGFSGTRWTNNTVYYSFGSTVTATNRTNWRNAAAQWSAVANLNFVESSSATNRIHVINDAGNWSYVGMIGGVQEMGIYNWSYRFIISHEIGHALGLSHEHSRSDRDSYVNIIWANIQTGRENNFELRATTNYQTYDFDSVMHYGKSAFAVTGNTIEPWPAYSSWLNLIGQRDHLSTSDQAGMAARYGAPPSSDDNYEENDTRAAAYNLSSNEQNWLNTINGYGIQADDDWYQISVTGGYEQVLIDVRFTDSAGDIDVQLVDSTGSVLDSSTSVTDNEYIDFTVPAGGTYFIRVYYGDMGNTYNLWWDDVIPAPASPDLVVTNGYVSDATLTPGQPFNIVATVRNQGGVSSASSTLRWYSSTNSTISTGDTPLGTDPVVGLAAGASSPENLSTTAPAGVGVYWVGACVDSVAGESNTSNQCSAGTRIAVSLTPPSDDFIWNLFLPAILMKKEKTVDGTWLRTYDWSCDGISGNTTDTIRPDHTWSSSGGYSGTWTLVGDTFTYFYPSGTTYRGTVNPELDMMVGTMISHSGSTGCWSSKRVNSRTVSETSTGQSLQTEDDFSGAMQGTEDASGER